MDQTIIPKEFPRLTGLDGISARTMTEHYKLYEGYIKKVNEITSKLGSADRKLANQTYSELRELKVELTFALGGVRNHELYFGHLGGSPSGPSGSLLKLLERDFGSLDKWREDLKATGLAARGWVWLAYDHEQAKLFNFLGDSQNTYPVWFTTPLLALDTYEHAYWMDYGADRAAYIEAFFKNLDWKVIEESFKKLNLKSYQ